MVRNLGSRNRFGTGLDFTKKPTRTKSQSLGPLFILAYYVSKPFGNPFEMAADQWAAIHQPPPPAGY
jgi:hypothetical protein